MQKLYAVTLVVMLSFSFNSVHAQDFLDKIVDSACLCISKLDTSVGNEKLSAEAGLCMLRYTSPYKKELKKKYNVDFENGDQKSQREFGKMMGMKMVTACPQSLMVLSKFVKTGEPAKKSTASDSYLVGNVTELQKNQFVTVIIQDVNGRAQKLLWLQYFHNSEKLKNIDQLKSTEMKFYYREMELYNAQLGDYMNYKVLTDIQKE